MVRPPAASGKVPTVPSRYERNEPGTTPPDRKETCRMVDDFERNFSLTLAKRKRNPIDRRMDQSLPGTLATRTARCIEALRKEQPYFLAPPTDRRGPVDISQPPERTAALQVTIEPKSKPRPLPVRVENWMGNFLRKPPGKRIQWSSRLYETEPGRKLGVQTPADRAEELLDAGAADFVRWLNGLGAERSSLTQDIVKQLFSSGSGDETSRALNIAPKEIRAVPETVATEWHRPELALENRIAQVLHARDRKQTPTKADAACRPVAFGRTLPRELRGERWKHADADEPDDVERPDVPEDLISLKRLFRDIWHLRSVKYLVDYLSERPGLARPRFLEEKGLFQRTDKAEPIPFYRKVLSPKSLAGSMKK